MSNNVKEVMSSIQIPEHLSEAANIGVARARLEQQHSRRMKWSRKVTLIAVASMIVITIAIVAIKVNTELNDPRAPRLAIGNAMNIQPPKKLTVDQQREGITIPAITLPQNSATADLIGLVVYNGKIYTQTDSTIDLEYAKQIRGEKLGTTTANIDEWSSQSEYSKELASSIGFQDVFAVNGYDKEFRIMSYMEYDEGEVYAEFYECLNGFTVYSGADIIGQLNIVSNIEAATYEKYSDWYYSTEQYNPITDLELLNTFVTELNEAKPYEREVVEKELGDFRNNEQYRHLTLALSDGTQATLTIVREGYVGYGNADVYFKLEDNTFQKVWAIIE